MYLLDTSLVSELRKDAPQSSALRNWLDQHVLPSFQGRILVVDTPVVRRCAELHVPNRRSERDALIAATALVHGMPVVTRNTSDFESTGVELINPWL
jgi:predicted nucleic acid-binding protein